MEVNFSRIPGVIFPRTLEHLWGQSASGAVRKLELKREAVKASEVNSAGKNFRKTSWSIFCRCV